MNKRLFLPILLLANLTGLNCADAGLNQGIVDLEQPYLNTIDYWKGTYSKLLLAQADNDRINATVESALCALEAFVYAPESYSENVRQRALEALQDHETVGESSEEYKNKTLNDISVE